MESGNCVKRETKKDTDILPNASKVRLWTWQKQGFDITNPNILVEPKYSKWLDASYNQGYCNRHQKAYKHLWEYLRTNQFLWYHTDFEDAINGSSNEEDNGYILWELNVPEDQVFKKICNMAWHWIVSDGIACPPKLFENHLPMNIFISFTKSLNQYWRNMNPQQLWDRLFVECWGQPCCQVLVRHPTDKSWIIKDPLKDANWWQNIVKQTAHCKTGFPLARE